MSVRSNGWSNEWLMIELSSLYGDEGSFFCPFGKKHKKDTGGNSMKNMVEIRWHGRGGQGAKTACLLLADASFASGKYVQGFPEYGQ